MKVSKDESENVEWMVGYSPLSYKTRSARRSA